MSSSPSILVLAGETSGDLHAAPVISSISRLRPDLKFFGAGGLFMRQAGVDLHADVESLAVMGFTGVPKILPRLARLKKTLLDRVTTEQSPLAILVDYPGFNLNLARALKQLPRPPKILYYIAPQLWAWREGRAKMMKASIDKLAVVFRFEIEFFRRFGIESDFVGHPLLDEIAPYLQTRPVKDPDRKLLALLPGSRPGVAARHLPLMLAAAERIRSKESAIHIAVGRASGLKDWNVWKDIERRGIEIYDDSRELLKNSTAAAVCSGTATLEAVLFDVPQVVVYKTSALNYIIARNFVKIPNVALANLTAGRTIVPELLQGDFSAGRLTEELGRALFDDSWRSEMIRNYSLVRQTLGESGAAERVAQIALGMI